MGFAKTAFSYALKNLGTSKFFAKNAWRHTRGITAWSATGAGLGATMGIFDNTIGTDNLSVLEGARMGAIMGAGMYGVRGNFRWRRNRNILRSAR